MADNHPVPYTYLIGWNKIGKWYYGCQYSAKAHPTNLWKTYFTSSKHVDAYRKKYGEPDVVEVRKIFYKPIEALNWEQRVLKKIKVKSNDKWLNVAIGKPTMLGKHHTPETRAKMRKPKPQGFGNIVRAIHTGKHRTEETKQKIRNTKINKCETNAAKNWVFLCNNEQITIFNLKKYCRDNNLVYSCMQDVFCGKQKQHKNYTRTQ